MGQEERAAVNLDDQIRDVKGLIVAAGFFLLGVGLLVGVVLARWIG